MMVLFCCWLIFGARADAVKVGSKAFTEAFVLGEWLAGEIETTNEVERKFGLGGTGIAFAALAEGDVDLYVEYTGTIAEAILREPKISATRMRELLSARQMVASPPLGFRNDYALATSAAFAARHHLEKISDLARVLGEARTAFSHEFIERADGWRGLKRAYGFTSPSDESGMDHALAFEAVARGRADVLDVYTTDAKIERMKLKVLDDDRRYFPSYEAVILTRTDWANAHPALWRRLSRLSGQLTADRVRGWNARVDVDGVDARTAIGKGPPRDAQPWWNEVRRRAGEHAVLVGVALMISVLLGVPLGVAAYRHPGIGRLILVLSGTIQTIPSLALLCFLIPVTGIGTESALVALCLYGLLPIVTNTLLGLNSIDPGLLEMARALKISKRQRLWHIELPLASRAILSGIRTSAVIGIGTATLAALIGAGGFGATIMAGLAINDTRLVWSGALPAAVMALGVQAVFAGIGVLVIPRGLRR